MRQSKPFQMKPWDEYSEEDDVRTYDPSFDLEAVLYPPTPPGGVEAEAETRLESPNPAPNQTPPSSEASTAPEGPEEEETRLESPNPPSPSVDTKSTGEAVSSEKDRQIQQLQEELLRVRAELDKEVLKNNTLEQTLKKQKRQTNDKSVQLEQATALLQRKDHYIYKQVMSTKELTDKLKIEIKTNETLKKSLKAQEKRLKERSDELEQANDLLQSKETHIEKKVWEIQELQAEVKHQEQKQQASQKQLDHANTLIIKMRAWTKGQMSGENRTTAHNRQEENIATARKTTAERKRDKMDKTEEEQEPKAALDTTLHWNKNPSGKVEEPRSKPFYRWH